MKDFITRVVVFFGASAFCISCWMGIFALAGIQLPLLAWLGISMIVLGLLGGAMTFREKGHGTTPSEWEWEEKASDDSIRVIHVPHMSTLETETAGDPSHH